jgi:hypothetical protein
MTRRVVGVPKDSEGQGCGHTIHHASRGSTGRSVPLLIERIGGGKVRHFRQYSVVAMVDTRIDGYEWVRTTAVKG